MKYLLMLSRKIWSKANLKMLKLQNMLLDTASRYITYDNLHNCFAIFDVAFKKSHIIIF